jgi:hypothetical protein
MQLEYSCTLLTTDEKGLVQVGSQVAQMQS